ncbi:type IV pilin [Natronomonas sp. CBA1123]|uniref:type IV pilin n=1 Tax=Natronomonas sp. CBA1123 TaxID=2668070 RepID=UPI0013078478|nr:type IV pilin [Natronomonas sp. CBA1123]
MSDTSPSAGVSPDVAAAVLLVTTLFVSVAIVGGLWSLGTGTQPGDSVPNVNWEPEQATTNLTVDGERIEVKRVTFRHMGGDTVDADRLRLYVYRNDTEPEAGIGPGASVARFDSEAVTKGDAVSVVGGATVDENETLGGFAIESVGGERRLTNENSVVELRTGDAVRLVWSDGKQSATLYIEEVE